MGSVDEGGRWRIALQVVKAATVAWLTLLVASAASIPGHLQHSATGLTLHHCRAHAVQGLEPQSWTLPSDSGLVKPEAGHRIWQVVVEIRNDAPSTRSVGHHNFLVRSNGQDVAAMPYWTQTESTSPSDILPARKGAIDVDLEPTERLLLHLLFSLPEDEASPELHVTSSRKEGLLAGPVFALMGLHRAEPVSMGLTSGPPKRVE